MADLSRFHDAQAPVIERAIAELAAGRKRTHWMWYVFPQLRGLGRSPMAARYGIADLDEAREYLADPLLAGTLSRAARAVLGHPEKPVETIMGGIDAMKLRSSATLFREAGGGPEFQAILDTFYGGKPCVRTLELLGR